MDHATDSRSSRLRLRPLSRFAATWALGYGLYRLYYAAGGEAGMLGTPASMAQWRLINAIAGVLLLGAALLPLVAMKAWSGRAGVLLLALAWLIAVACVSHALIGITQRLLSLNGALTIPYPFWHSIDRRKADWQALTFNEPWFLIEGLLWVAMAWVGRLSTSPHRRHWVYSAIMGMVAATAVGVLTALGVFGRVIVG